MLDNTQVPGDNQAPDNNQDQLALLGGGLTGMQGQANDQANAAGAHAQSAHTRIGPSSPGGGQNAGPAISSPSGWFGTLVAAIGKIFS